MGALASHDNVSLEQRSVSISFPHPPQYWDSRTQPIAITRVVFRKTVTRQPLSSGRLAKADRVIANRGYGYVHLYETWCLGRLRVNRH